MRERSSLRSTARSGTSVPDSTTFDYEARVREAMLRKLRIDIGRLDRESIPEDISSVIDRIVASDLDEITADWLLSTIKQQTGSATGLLRKQLNKAQTWIKKVKAEGNGVPVMKRSLVWFLNSTVNMLL